MADLIISQIPVISSVNRSAPNILFLFSGNRPAVVNAPRRGRLPRCVALFSSHPLKIGDLAELCRGALKANHGKVVRITGYLPITNDYEIEAVDGFLHTYDRDTGEATGLCASVKTSAHNVRKPPAQSATR